MDYGSQSNQIESSAKNLWRDARNISSSSFDGYWSGSAHDKLTGDLDSAINAVTSVVAQVGTFIDAVAKLEEYKDCKEKIDANESTIAGLDREKDAAQISSLQAENAELQTKKDSLRAEIEGVIASITSYSSSGTLISC